MNEEQKQQLLVEYLISSPDTFVICKKILQAKYFVPDLKKSVSFIIDYHNKYNAIPEVDVMKAETDKDFKKHNITKDQREYCINEIESFCRRKALEEAVVEAATQKQRERFVKEP